MLNMLLSLIIQRECVYSIVLNALYLYDLRLEKCFTCFVIFEGGFLNTMLWLLCYHVEQCAHTSSMFMNMIYSWLLRKRYFFYTSLPITIHAKCMINEVMNVWMLELCENTVSHNIGSSMNVHYDLLNIWDI